MITNANLWHDFKTDPPYDAHDDIQQGLEVDEVWGWFIYVHTHRPANMNSGPFLSHKASRFCAGVFEGYESQMKTSAYSSDRIEVLAWAEDTAMRGGILAAYKIKHAQ